MQHTESQRWQRWVANYRAHRASHYGSYWTWEPGAAVRVVTRHTGGRLEFADAGDLAELVALRRSMTERMCAVRDSFARELLAVKDACPGVENHRWHELASEFDVDGLELVIAVGELDFAPSRADTPPEVAGVQRACDSVAFMNPVTRAWELLQALRLWQAAVDLVVDAMADLIRECEHLSPTELSFAAGGVISSGEIVALESSQRRERGLPGDARRRYSQWGSLPRADRMWSQRAQAEALETRTDVAFRLANGLPAAR